MYTIDNKPFKGTLLEIEKDGLGVFSRKGRDNIKVQSSNVVWSFIGRIVTRIKTTKTQGTSASYPQPFLRINSLKLAQPSF